MFYPFEAVMVLIHAGLYQCTDAPIRMSNEVTVLSVAPALITVLLLTAWLVRIPIDLLRR